MREPLIATIIELEWGMFSAVNNAGGRAPCQMDPATFEIMRSSQANAWPEELLASWLADLTEAGQAGRNLMSEKYAWMMESTHPEEFARIADRLPSIDVGTLALIEDIVAVNLAWKEEVAERYPALSDRGRPIYTAEDTPGETSFETYLRGELKTYSPRTVRLLHAHTADQKARGINSVAETLLHQVRHYGYPSLGQAERGNRR